MLPVALLPTANCRWISLDIATLGHNLLENSHTGGHSKNMVKKCEVSCQRLEEQSLHVWLFIEG